MSFGNVGVCAFAERTASALIRGQGIQRVSEGLRLELVRKHDNRVRRQRSHGSVRIGNRGDAGVHAVKYGGRGFTARQGPQLNRNVGCCQIVTISLGVRPSGNGDIVVFGNLSSQPATVFVAIILADEDQAGLWILATGRA
jgi:hypothetical protein